METQRMLSLLRKGITSYKMIKPDDKIAVGVSGGKDSITLLKLLAEYKRFSPEPFDLVALSVDLAFGGVDSDFSEIEKFCKDLDVPYFVKRTQIGEIVFDARKEKSPCALCSKMRKGALYELAKEKNCNKVALGHHASDMIETFILSLFYEGRLSTFAPKSYLDRTELTLIRPMIFIDERDVVGYAKNFPVVKSRCPADKHTKREEVKKILSELGKTLPQIRDMLFTALIHPERYNLFDKFEKDSELIP